MDVLCGVAYRGVRRGACALACLVKGAPPMRRGRRVARISAALRARDWEDALELMAASRETLSPKLGTLQRWVREADLVGRRAGSADGTNWAILDGILRASRQPTFASGGLPVRAELGGARLRVFAPWAAVPRPDATPQASSPAATASPGADAGAPAPAPSAGARVLATERRWKGVRDLNIYAAACGAAPLLEARPGHHRLVGRHPLPFVDGAFVLSNVLLPRECAALIRAAEAVGYAPDAEYVANPEGVSSGGHAAFGLVWLGDDGLMGELFRRVQPHLPAELAGEPVVGLNARLRFYRYQAGAVYRPHVDGAWPGSGVVDGRYCFDAHGDRWSRLTFLLYLNDGFEGGTTTFFGPSPAEGVLDCRGVVPQCGAVLCFPHGSTAGALVHEGSEVTRGAKYVVRTDVLYRGGRQALSLNAPGARQ